MQLDALFDQCKIKLFFGGFIIDNPDKQLIWIVLGIQAVRPVDLSVNLHHTAVFQRDLQRRDSVFGDGDLISAGDKIPFDKMLLNMDQRVFCLSVQLFDQIFCAGIKQGGIGVLPEDFLLYQGG